ncbi:MAG: PEGA domain-containing protein [Candidatus Marinimicrobia bacterium]|nr:PEGA domain-containing protein [Candidatus Neomarinimicrobiota bacterium]
MVLTFTFAQEKKTLAIYPFEGKGGTPTTMLSVFSDELENQILEMGRFRMVTRKEIEKVIREQNFQVNCSATECAIKLGEFIGADIIIGKITQLQRNKYYFVIKVIETESGEIYTTVTKTVVARNNNDIAISTAHHLARELSDKMINPGMMDFDVDPYGASILVDGEFQGNTPQYGVKILAGEHLVSIQKVGYETWEESFTILEGKSDYYAPIEMLKPKRRLKAIGKSILFPGNGQLYQSDDEHKSRAIIGNIFKYGTITAMLGTAYGWYSFNDAQSKYNDAYQLYLQQTDLDLINSHREMTEDLHRKMQDTEKVAITFIGAVAGLWLLNIMDVAINFPDYGIDLAGAYDFETQSPTLTVGVAW